MLAQAICREINELKQNIQVILDYLNKIKTDYISNYKMLN